VFRLWAPRAGDVQLTGNWMGPQPVSLVKDTIGVWSVTAGPFEPNMNDLLPLLFRP
jgi:1,4-alpha-glucan branching enzyme